MGRITRVAASLTVAAGILLAARVAGVDGVLRSQPVPTGVPITIVPRSESAPAPRSSGPRVAPTGIPITIVPRVAYEPGPSDPAGRPADPDATGLVPAAWAEGIPPRAARAEVTDITDGDTIGVRYEDGREETIRILLIDTPETKHPDEPVQCFGPEATKYVAGVIPPGTEVFLEGDIEDRDRYSRQLRYVWLEIDGVVYLVNENIVRNGYAVRSIYPPNVKYVDQIGAAQTYAREHNLGVWGNCGSWPEAQSE